jgi:hypothetical protein
MIATRQGGRAPRNIVSCKSVFSGRCRGTAAPLAGAVTLSAILPSRPQRQM